MDLVFHQGQCLIRVGWGALRIAGCDLGGAERNGERCAEFVRGVGHELTLKMECLLEAVEQGIEARGEPLKIAGRFVQPDASAQVSGSDSFDCLCEFMEWRQ